MDLIVDMRFGSHLYGTQTPSSDLDYKAVYLPAARDILLHRVRGTITEKVEKAPGEKNRPGDVDRDTYSLQHYLDMLAEGQTVALDMLFAPDAAMTRPPSPLWREIQANAPCLVTRRSAIVVRYCRRQANKYGIKGSRVATARQALAVLTTAEATYGPAARLGEAEAELRAFVGAQDHAALVEVPSSEDKPLRHLEVCGKQMPFTASIRNARETARRLVDDYGQRALQAERNDGVDWKALSHAVRVGHQALELLGTGKITFPLPNAADILAIKRGEQPYETVAATIEHLLTAVETAAATSTLPDEPDRDFIDTLIVRAHRAKVLEAP
ncbi:DNA polymerase beta superfamily protein [Rhodospirillum rubrum]|uniref:Nucleotidyltransferase n=1 Tax=Rhodospirillum rubrum (strain ATCC 11170 / ATH 1.1.1 / DSM 467 / LMG 4362 / NCIMB 8255 / S1) TaxID=269796 RepID=Q2RXF0_RHORT|nr:nucleotidyltransferase domain-containing protein [Rhodospirillum rubrum]ABC21195.1 hypothetical protein Rru_A0390 [Rhodospirillum rubrum ATCC 11170]AEO46869.1 hypothetical protein F11_01995 [Rhodospirillum rubrum F11]MBK5952743.1 hypothetical protein [Rhodospirillum rubrum]QXG80886.1 nucleotidyltransferase domain-containing protein [Rhodospirillum rubrum]HCF19030.1 hypothetical protein [Rhodospirillum rubrum]